MNELKTWMQERMGGDELQTASQTTPSQNPAEKKK